MGQNKTKLVSTNILVQTGKGKLMHIYVASPASNSNLQLSDDDGTGSKTTVYQVDGSADNGHIMLELPFYKGIYATVSGSATYNVIFQ